MPVTGVQTCALPISLKPLLNKTISGLYSPGSTIKPIVALSALENDVISPKFKVNCTGKMEMYGQTYHCWKKKGHGVVNLKKAIKQSCDTYFYEISRKLGVDRLNKTALKFGLGEKVLNNVFSDEKKGLVPEKSYLNRKYGKWGWATGNLLTFVIGQGDVLVTPVQVAQMMSIIATRGNTKTPHLLVDSPSEDIIVSLESTTWDFLQQATWDVVNH
jgi:penicillin-binding protein 2